MEISEIGQCIQSHLFYDKSHTEVKGVRDATSVDSYCFISKSCLTFWDPLDCITPGFPVLQNLLELAQIHVYWVGVMSIASSATPLSFHLSLSTFPSIRVFSKGSTLCIRWSKCWNVIFGISPSNEYSGLISFRTDSRR